MLPFKDYDKMLDESFIKPSNHPLSIGNEFLIPSLSIKKGKIEDLNFLKKFAEEQNWKLNIDISKISKPLTAAIITDTNQKIEWVSSYFLPMTGYQKEEALGKHPKFLQGEKTSIEDRLKIRKQLSALKPFHGQLLNYRKDGEPYLCKVEILPIFNKNGEHVNFIAFETDRI